MAYIRKRTLANGKRAYLVCWVDPDGRETSEQFSGSGDIWDQARAKKASVEHELRAGSYVDSQAGRIKFETYAARWLSNQISRDSSQRNYERTLRLHINPVLGNRSLSTIRRSDILALVKKVSETLAPKTVQGVHALTGAIFSAAVFDRLIPRTPVEKIPLPKITASEIVIPTVDQVHAIADALPPNLHGMVLAAATTGLRLGELRGITLESLNFFARTITVRPDLGQMVTVPGAGPQLAPPKSAASARVVPLGEVALTVFSEHLRARPADADDGFGGLVFQSVRKAGGPVSVRYVSDHLSVAVAEHGFPPGTGMHVFRHFYASGLIAAGVNAKIVQVRMGHATIGETFNTYGHLMPDDDDVSRHAIDAAFGLNSTQATMAARP